MNIKYTVKSDSGWILTCVVDGGKDLKPQFEEILYIRPGNGIGLTFLAEEIEVTDYYHGSAVALFKILSREETEESVSLRWTEVRKEN